MELRHIREAARRMVPATDALYYPSGVRADEAWRRFGQSPAHERIVSGIRAEGERLRDEPVPELTEELFGLFERTGSRLEYEKLYFERRRRLNTFALLSLLEPEEEGHRHRLLGTIRRILDEPTWCLPAHVSGADAAKTIDLFSAETGFTLCEMANVLGGWLPTSLAADIDRAVEERLIRPYLQDGPHPWETARHNWSAVCAGSIGAAALLRISDIGTLTSVLTKSLASLDCYLQGFGADGACTEGLGYWNYGFGYYVYFADLLKKRTRGEIDLFRQEKVRNIALFQQSAYLHGDLVAGFSDSLPRLPFRIGLTHYLARLYPEVEVPGPRYAAEYAEDHCSRWAPAFRDLVWLDSGRSGDEWGAADRFLPDAQWLISRHVTASGRRFGFAAKGGHNGEPHNHNDIGQFILVADGMTAAADLGCGEYTAAYFGEGRYDYDCNGSQGHSVPIIDGAGQAAGASSSAIVLEATIGGREDRLRLEMASAYRSVGLKSLVRNFRWIKSEPPILVLSDEFVFDPGPHRIVERVVTLIPPVIEGGGTIRLGAEEGPKTRIRYDESKLEASVGKKSDRDHFGRDRIWYVIDWTLQQVEAECRIELRFEWEGESHANSG